MARSKLSRHTGARGGTASSAAGGTLENAQVMTAHVGLDIRWERSLGPQLQAYRCTTLSDALGR